MAEPHQPLLGASSPPVPGPPSPGAAAPTAPHPQHVPPGEGKWGRGAGRAQVLLPARKRASQPKDLSRDKAFEKSHCS